MAKQQPNAKVLAYILPFSFSFIFLFFGGFLFLAFSLGDINTTAPIVLLILGAICVISGIIVVFYQKKQKQQEQIRSSIDWRVYLGGMMKAEGKINLGYVSRQMGMKKEQLRMMIYNMVGQGKLNGRFQGDDFILAESSLNDLDGFLDVLDNEFETWKGMEQQGIGKKI